MRTIAKIGLLALLTGSADARIGDTKEQCAARYQNPAEKPSRFDNIYYKDGLETACLFGEDGRCESISFRIAFSGGVADVPYGEEPRFTEAQAVKLLALNAGGSGWDKKPGSDRGYVTQDGSRHALISNSSVTVELVARYERIKAATTPEAITKTVDAVCAEPSKP